MAAVGHFRGQYSLLGLPTEVRLEILRTLFIIDDDEKQALRLYGRDYSWPPPFAPNFMLIWVRKLVLNLLLCCKKIHQEILDVTREVLTTLHIAGRFTAKEPASRFQVLHDYIPPFLRLSVTKVVLELTDIAPPSQLYKFPNLKVLEIRTRAHRVRCKHSYHEQCECLTVWTMYCSILPIRNYLIEDISRGDLDHRGITSFRTHVRERDESGYYSNGVKLDSRYDVHIETDILFTQGSYLRPADQTDQIPIRRLKFDLYTGEIIAAKTGTVRVDQSVYRWAYEAVALLSYRTQW